MPEFNRCPACAYANPAKANFCNACGAGLRLRKAPVPRTTPQPAADAALPELHLSDALRADELRAANPGGAGERSGQPAAWHLIDVQAPSPEPPAEAPPALELIRSDPEDAFRYNGFIDERGAARPPGQASPLASEAERRDAKAARRAAVRRVRIARQAAQSSAALAPADVLVLDPDEPSREALCTLLEGFGFRVDRAHSAAHAGEMLSSRSFAAVFLDIALDGSDQGAGLELCQRAQDLPAGAEGQPLALIILADQARPMDRVRAELAGGKRFLIKPAGRGDVVRALEECGVALPADARRG